MVIIVSAIFPLYCSTLVFLTSGCPRLHITVMIMFLDLSAAAKMPVEPSCLKQFDIFEPGQTVSNPYALVLL